MSIFRSKSRFYFNISVIQNINFFVKKIINFRESKLINHNEIFDIYKKSNIYFLEHGRSAFYLFLISLKKKTNRKKIIINSFTLFEMINMIIYAGFEPILIDLKENSLETNAKEKILEIEKDLAAVVITHLNGFNNDVFQVKNVLEKINSNNKSEKIYLIEDCAVSLGSNKDGQYSGNIGDFAILSFNIMKNITTLTGGALIDNYKKLEINSSFDSFKKEKSISSIKKSIFVMMLQLLNSKIFFIFFFQFIKFSHKNNLNFFLKKYRTDFKVFIKKIIPDEYLKKMDPLKKEFLIDQFPKIFNDQYKRVEKAKIYYQKLSNLDCFYFPQKIFDSSNIFIDFPIICKNYELKNFIWEKSLINNIDIKNYYYTNCGSEKIYEIYKEKEKLKNSDNVAKNIFMLPVNKNFNNKDIEKIVNFLNETVKEWINEKK
tara:strand:+ start:615 stop:1907 length:1293 start_codon:yes stop_codon:yes gene_type:complete